MPPDDAARIYLTSAEATALLGIRIQTLYAYVSKGLIRSVKQVGTKERLYRRDDILRVQARSMARSGHGAVAGAALQWGEPVVPTSITELTPEGPRYRGRLAMDLAVSGGSFEAVAELLWTGLWHPDIAWPRRALPPLVATAIAPVLSVPQGNGELAEILAMVVLRLGLARGTVEERIVGGQTQDAAREIITAMAGCFGMIGPARSFHRGGRGSVAQRLLEAMGVDAHAANVHALQVVLVLFADHELSSSTFVARVAASVGASLHSCVSAALCSASGVELSRNYDRIEDFLHAGTSRPALMKRAVALHQQGLGVPGFSHPLYPEGDARAVGLLAIARERSDGNKRLRMLLDFVDQVSQDMGLPPRHELGALAVAQAIGLPRYSTGAVFMLARTAGWVAHVQEQRRAGQMIRPRAKFVAAGA